MVLNVSQKKIELLKKQYQVKTVLVECICKKIDIRVAKKNILEGVGLVGNKSESNECFETLPKMSCFYGRKPGVIF